VLYVIGQICTSTKPEMSGLSYFAIHIQSGILKTQSKSNHSPKLCYKFKVQLQIKSKKLTKYSFPTTTIT